MPGRSGAAGAWRGCFPQRGRGMELGVPGNPPAATAIGLHQEGSLPSLCAGPSPRSFPWCCCVLALLPFHFSTSPRVAHPASQISDDALLEQVDEQVSVAVPSSMESLTHLVSTQNSAGSAAAAPGSKHIVQTN